MHLGDKVAEALVNVLEHYRSSQFIETHAAAAVVAALPDMIAPLVWEHPDRYASRSGLYVIRRAPFEERWTLYFGETFVVFDLDKDLLEVKANAHHSAAIMAAFNQPKEPT